MFRKSKIRYVALGSAAFFLFGMGLLIIGGRLALYQYLLTGQGQKVIGVVTETGSVQRTSGGWVDYIRYRFQDASGNFHTGLSSNYSGVTGESVLLEYSPSYPFIHRVSGEGKRAGYTWRWAMCGAGLLFCMAGIHWWVYTLKRIRLAGRLAREGRTIQGFVKKITDNGRTIQYEYNTGSDLYQGKTMALPMALVKQYKESDPVEVLFDPARHELSVLKLER
ncbi:MAG: DUF3592 domain-containing protein [Desulfobacteraceae bacterium]|nr:MAG: DUF3592 domain-containing protein [Desulfobacteraceae bacterium]